MSFLQEREQVPSKQTTVLKTVSTDFLRSVCFLTRKRGTRERFFRLTEPSSDALSYFFFSELLECVNISMSIVKSYSIVGMTLEINLRSTNRAKSCRGFKPRSNQLPTTFFITLACLEKNFKNKGAGTRTHHHASESLRLGKRPCEVSTD